MQIRGDKNDIYDINSDDIVQNDLDRIQSKKKTILKVLSVIAITATITAVGFVNYYQQLQLEQERQEILQALEISKQEAIRENNRISELKKEFPGVGMKGLDDAHSSKDILERLRKGDYSAINGEKVVFLTYDDGPSLTNTPVILDTLKKHQVRATFFVTGNIIDEGGEEAKKILRESYEYGNSIGNHSYTHNYRYLYPNRRLNLEQFLEDFKRAEVTIKEVLGDDFNTNVWRCPGGYMSWRNMQELDEYVDSTNISYIDWNALNKDAEGKPKNAEELYQEAVASSQNKDMVVLLMHDTYGKEQTAIYTDKIIQYYKDQGYVFKVLG